MKIGEIMQKMGFVSREQVEEAVREQAENRKQYKYTETIGNIMLRKGHITEDQHNQILLEYYRLLTEDAEQPSYVQETAKVAMLAMNKKGELGDESKLALIRRIYDFQEKINQFEKSIATLKKVQPKKVILETIGNEEREIQILLKRMEGIRNDLARLS